ncbi:ABC transporter ATP-binding protein [Rhodocytophaga aerolata]|uniref:ABC transporter ATP-binding protein n=1 Tax=Rhodocytophaga aerolata TaxID=455078 RepID=A0ABT8RCZ3_9BACT|nr:ABC transporter ATP-binding protein [Rhodocytophaga aerolata]MDO1448555.1 ABC transporter ATP-binding protein [Rhodocytophaga aerolata]
MKPLLQAKNVQKRYPGQETDALTNVSLTIHPHELLAIVGASGSGKTTLLKILAGLEEADEGEVWIQDELIPLPSQQLIPGHPKIKMVFQDNKLFPNIHIYDTIQHTLRAYPHSYQQERIAEVLELCKLTHLQHKYPRELSGGEQQRATLARALADEPLLLLLDEPFSHLDLPLKRQIKKDIQEILQASGITAILVTHDTTDALSMADRIILMKNGHFVQTDTPANIYTRPATPYVARFFGDANIVDWALVQSYLPENTFYSSAPQQKVCIRAENIAMGTSAHFHCKGQVVSMEYLGAYSLIEVEINKNFSLVLRTAEHTIQIGEWLPLLIDIPKIHFFP